MKLAAAFFCLLSLPALALGQYAADPGEQSIVRPAGYGWRNNVTVPVGCGCSAPVRADCYDQPCCFRCGLHPICFLQRVHRMLDCLLPCHTCGTCCGCGPLGGCLLGGRCGGCACNGCSSCCSPNCGCSSGMPGLPGLSDPFLDDPVPPKPAVDTGTQVRLQPQRPQPMPLSSNRISPTASSPRTPWKVTTGGAAPASRPVARPMPRPSHTAAATQQYSGMTVTARPATPKPKLAQPAEQSVLRRTSAEEPAPLQIEAARPIVRSQSPDDEEAVPFNPLRGR